jgi:hypothetical protein
MEISPLNGGTTLEPEQAAAKAAILAECDKLFAVGITFVAVHFDGCGDEGATEDVKCYKSEEYAHEEGAPDEHDASHLQEHFEALVPYGYEIGCGGFGDIILNVKAKTISIVRNDYFEDYTTSTYEV